MKTLSLIILLAVGYQTIVSAQYKPSDVLVTVNKQPVSAGEFERIYQKNQNINSVDKQTVAEYFDLFIKFKLKVTAAHDAGLDTLTSFQTEFKSYRDQLAKTYLTDNEASEKLLQEAYYRMVNEVNVSHIMVRLSELPSPADTLAAYQKITAIRNRIIAGESFDKLATDLSEDPSAKTNHGNLGYFSAFRFPYAFENASYNTKPGEISLPVRTKYGYHLIRVNDKRKSPGEVKVAHIMVAIPQNSPEEKWAEGKEKIDKIYDRILKGEDFGALARELSDDRNTGKNNGELPWFGSGRMVPEFESAAFALKTPESVSVPVKTFFGWHIIKLLDKRPIAPFDQVKNDLKSKISRDERADFVNISFLNKLKKNYKWKENKDNLLGFYQLDSAIYKGKYILSEKINKKLPVLTIQDKVFTIDDFNKYLYSNPIPKKGVAINTFIDQSYDKFLNASFIQFEDLQLDKKYPDFHNLVNEYHDGILLYDIMDREVWNKASHDSAGILNFYKQVSDKYIWGERLEATIYYCKNETIAKKVKKVIEASGNNLINYSEIIKSLCDSTTGPDCIKIEQKLFSKGDNSLIDSINWIPQITDLTSKNNQVVFVKVDGVHKPEPKKLEEVRGLVTAEYQNTLEDKWISELKTKYKVVVNQDLLNKIAEKYKNNH